MPQAARSGQWGFSLTYQAGQTAWWPAMSMVDPVTGNAVSPGAGASGAVAAGTADNGSAPVKTGAVGRSGTPAAVADGQITNDWDGTRGQRAVMITDNGGSAPVNVVNVVAAGDGANLSAQTLLVGAIPMVSSGGFQWLQRGDANATTVRSAVGSASWAYASATGGITTSAATAMMAAGGAGVRNYLHGIQFKNTSATASEIVVLDGATVIWRAHVSASMTIGDSGKFDPPLRGTANTALNVQLLTAGTATIVSAHGSQGV